tara:strand:- start:242 stop:613 length:372 start_codon:yes stop_codon:yes gene_type:complete
MATLTPTLTLASTDISASEALNLSVTDSLAIAGGATQFQVATSTSSAVFASAANFTKSYVYLRNLSTTAAEIITIEKAASGDTYMTLGAEEFAFFPWASTVDLFADAAQGTPILEVRIFQAAS